MKMKFANRCVLVAAIAAAVLLESVTARLAGEQEQAKNDVVLPPSSFTHPKLLRNLQGKSPPKQDYIVVLQPGIQDVRGVANAILQRSNNGAAGNQQPAFVYEKVLKGFFVENPPEAVLLKMLDDADVAYIEAVR